MHVLVRVEENLCNKCTHTVTVFIYISDYMTYLESLLTN